MKSGLRLDKEPWLLPQDAFKTLEDCFLQYGVLRKRRGSTFFAQMLDIATTTKAPVLQTTTVMGIFNHYTTAGLETLLCIDTLRFNKYLTTIVSGLSVTLSDAGGGEVNATATGHGLVTDNIVTISDSATLDATYSITKVSADVFKFTATWHASNTTGTANQERLIDLTRNSIRFQHASKQNWTPAADDVVKGATSGATATVLGVVVDTGTFGGTDANGTIIFKNGTVSGTFQNAEELQENGTPGNKVGDTDGTATDGDFTGDDSNFFWFENWKGVAYFTNNQDQIRKYDGTYVTKFNIDLDVEGGPDNDVNTCLLIFHMEGRIILLRTTERSIAHYQRLRWFEINSTTTAKDANYSDAPRDDAIIGADFIGGELIVWFERGVMKIVYTGDPDTPFKWEKVDSVEGCYATMSLAAFSNEIICVGPTRFLSCDGREVTGIDDKIPDLMLAFKQTAVKYCYAMVIEEVRQALISYASASSDKPDKALVLNYDEDNFAIFNLPIHVMGYSSLLETLSTDDMVGISLDDLDYSLDDKELQAGYPTSLMGCRDGKIYKMNDGGSDDGVAIEMKAKGGRWNPYFKENKRARLKKIDFLVDRVNTTFDVKFFINSRGSSYQTKTIDCSDDDISRERVWRTARCGAVADFHQIKIDHDTVGISPRIHALVLHFRPAGPIR